MPFQPNRLRELRELKGLSQEQLAEVSCLSQSAIAKSEKGKSTPKSSVLDKLASALDCTMDYLYGRGREFRSATEAAQLMAFDVFANDPKTTDAQREYCRKTLRHSNVPRTAVGWRELAEMIESALGPKPSASANLAVVRQRPQSRKH